MEEQKKKTDAAAAQPDLEGLKRLALWKLGAVAVTLFMCGILLLYLVVDKPSQAELTIAAYARANKISVLQYPEELIRVLEDNPEAEAFVLNYPFREENPEIHLGTWNMKNGMPTLMQWDRRWGYLEYGDGMVCTTGSGPLCMAMVGYYLTGSADFHPDRVVKFARNNGFYVEGSGTKHAFISVGGPALGLNVTEMAPEEDKIVAYLKAGIPVIASVDSGDFAFDNHYIVMWGYENGRVKIVDPYSSLNSGKAWEFSDLRKSVNKLWVIQK